MRSCWVSGGAGDGRRRPIRFAESDWRIRRDTAGGVETIRVARGYEAPDGTPDPQAFNAYWFDGQGLLVKSFKTGLEERNTDFRDFNGVKVAHQVDVLSGGKLGLRISVTELAPVGTVDTGMFVLKGSQVGHGTICQ